MRIWILIAIIAGVGLLQVTILDYIKIFNVKPDLLLVSVVLASLVIKFRWALVLSVFAGVLKDSFGASTFGINTLLFGIWSFLIMKLSKKITIDNNFIRTGLMFIVTFFHHTITGLTLIYLGTLVTLGPFLRIVFVESIYTTLVFPLIFKISEATPYGIRRTT